MKVTAATFVISAARAADLPRGDLAEVAMVGRSNVGKSTLINTLVGRTIARTSAAPGKTRLVNIYKIDRPASRPFHLVDLPGYGYARGGSDRQFASLLDEYFFGGGNERRIRPAIAGVVLLVDSRHPGLAADLEAANWLGRCGIAMLIVATKIDKLTQKERRQSLDGLQAAFDMPTLPVSARTGEGLTQLWKHITEWLNQR